MGAGVRTWFRPPYLAIPGLSRSVILFLALGAQGAVTSLQDIPSLFGERPLLPPSLVLVEALIQLALAAVAARSRTTLQAVLRIGIWGIADVVFHCVYAPWAFVLFFVHLAQLNFVSKSLTRAATWPAHETQDRLLVSAFAFATFFPGLQVVLLMLRLYVLSLGSLLPMALCALVCLLASTRARARRVWLARLSRQADDRWAIVPESCARVPSGLMALTPTDRLDSAVIETRPASPTYRDPALPEALALTTFNAAPVVAPPASPHNVVLVGFLSIPIILLVLGSLVGRHILRRSDAIENPYEALGRIADLAGATYDPVRGYCPSASAPVPPAVPRARLYTSAPGDWLTDKDAGAGFACLGFSRTQAQLYQYSYIASPDRRSFDVIVRGDLNGDGVSSTLRTHGTIGPNGRTSRSPYPDETTGE